MLRRRRWRGPASLAVNWFLLPLAITFVAWQAVALQPQPGIDPSWQAGLAMAAHSGLTYGTQVVWTYGPLGWLSNTSLWFSQLGLLAFLYTVLIRFGLAVAVFASARRSFGAAGSFVLGVVVASIGGGQLGEPVIVLIAAVWAITTTLERRQALLVGAGLGAFTALQLLNKQSVGVSLFVLSAVTLLSLPAHRRDAAAMALAAGLLSLTLCWLALGADLVALPSYVAGLLQIATGYAAAMSLDASPVAAWTYSAAAIALAIGIWAALAMTKTSPTRARMGAAALWVAFWFFGFKEGFVRMDAAHLVFFFGALPAGFLAFRANPGRRLGALLCVAVLVVFTLAVAGQSLTAPLHPFRNVRTAFSQARTVLSVRRRSLVIADGRALIHATEPIDPASVALLSGHTATVFPSELVLAWAYRLRWRPEPVLQSYAAYTPALDRLDADFFGSSRAPERMLLQPASAIDGRMPWFDEPETSRAILCRYRMIRRTPTVGVLGLGSDRCGAPRLLRTVYAGWGQQVTVPAPPEANTLVFAKITGLDPGIVERAVSVLYKPAQQMVVLNAGPPHRLVAATAADGLPLRVIGPLDYPAPFNVAAAASTIAVTKGGQSGGGSGPITFAFYAQSLQP